MRKIFLQTITIICAILIISFSACKKNDFPKYIDLAIYYETNVICYDESNKSTDMSLDFFTGEKTPQTYRFTQIIFDGKSKWTSDLFVESIEFDVFSNEKATFDFTLSISNIAESEGKNVFYSEEYAYHYFQEEFSVTIEPDSIVHKKVLVGKTLNDKEGGIGLVLDRDSTLALSSSLGYYITNFKVIAYHK